MTTLYVMTLLIIKHFVIDFPLQTQYQLVNKGKYGHLGGLLHAALHGVGTWLVLVWSVPVAAITLAFCDAVIHYHIDWAKVNINNKFEWAPSHNQFWWLFGFDQLLHYLTYAGFVFLLSR